MKIINCSVNAFVCCLGNELACKCVDWVLRNETSNSLAIASQLVVSVAILAQGILWEALAFAVDFSLPRHLTCPIKLQKSLAGKLVQLLPRGVLTTPMRTVEHAFAYSDWRRKLRPEQRSLLTQKGGFFLNASRPA